MRTKAISSKLFRSYQYSTRNSIPFAWPLLRSSFPKFTSTHQSPGATSPIDPNPHPMNSVVSSPLGSLMAMADVPLPNINPPPCIDPRPGPGFLSATELLSLKPEIPSDQPQNLDIPMPGPPTHEPGRTPPGVDPPMAPPEVTPPPNTDPPPGVEPIPDIPVPRPRPDFPSFPIPSPSKPEIPREPRNPEMPIPPPPSPPEIIPPQII